MIAKLNGPRPRPPEDRFWPKVDKRGPVPGYRPDLGPCWLWTGAISSSGYGAFYAGRGRLVTAHSFAWSLENGAIPDGYEVDHLCRVTACCNPSHLEAVSRSVNQRRGVGPEKSRDRQGRKTHCPKGHPYAGENLIVAKTGYRECRACRIQWKRLRRAGVSKETG